MSIALDLTRAQRLDQTVARRAVYDLYRERARLVSSDSRGEVFGWVRDHLARVIANLVAIDSVVDRGLCAQYRVARRMADRSQRRDLAIYAARQHKWLVGGVA